MPFSRARTMPNSERSRMASPIISLYRSSKMWRGNRVRGKTTTCSGNSGSSRDGMLLLLRPHQTGMRIEGKVVLITGASEGIGAACAREFAGAGARLSLTARNEAGLRAAGGPDALVTPGDIISPEV